MAETTDVWRGTLALMILKTLETLGPLHGYGVARRIEQTSGGRLSVHYGTIYPALLKLVQEGAKVAICGRRADVAESTVAELKRLMRQRVPEGEIGRLLVDMVILRLKEQKYLNDSSYAASYSAFRRDGQKFGKRRVITDLKGKGVHSDVIEKAVDEAYESIDEPALARAFLKRIL